MRQEKNHRASSFFQAKDVPFFSFLYLDEIKEFFYDRDFGEVSNY
jgi:hypothetical protein